MQRGKALESAKLFMKRCAKLIVWDHKKPEHAVGELMSFRRDFIAAKLGIDQTAIPAYVLLNWSTPCGVPAAVQNCQVTTLTWALTDNMQSAAMALSPVFTYNKGQLQLEEYEPEAKPLIPLRMVRLCACVSLLRHA